MIKTLKNRTQISTVKQQKGTVIVVAMILLVIVAVGSVSVFSGVKSDSQMNENFEQNRLAFQAAEEALRRIEKQQIKDIDFVDDNFLNTCAGTQCFTQSCAQGLCKTTDYATIGVENCSLAITPPVWEDETIRQNAPSINITLDRSLVDPNAGVITLPVKYLIEFRCYVPKVAQPEPTTMADWSQYFRVTVWLDRDTPLSAPIMLQSTFQKG